MLNTDEARAAISGGAPLAVLLLDALAEIDLLRESLAAQTLSAERDLDRANRADARIAELCRMMTGLRERIAADVGRLKRYEMEVECVASVWSEGYECQDVYATIMQTRDDMWLARDA